MRNFYARTTTILCLGLLSSTLLAQELSPFKGHTIRQLKADRIVKTDKMDVLVVEPKFQENDAPVLVVLKGFLPMAGYVSYSNIIWNNAKRGATVLVPIYKPDRYYGAFRDTTRSIGVNVSGVSTEEIGLNVIDALKDLWPQFLGRKVYIYGHSMGALIAPFVAENLQPILSGLILDGVPSAREVGDENGFVHQQCQTKARSTLSTQPTAWPFPVHFFHYEYDENFEAGMLKMFDCVRSEFKQIIQIHSYTDSQGVEHRADHFSPMSYNPLKIYEAWYESLYLMDDVIRAGVKSIHEYPLNITYDVVDEYGSETLIPSVVFAHSAAPRNTNAYRYAYGAERSLTHEGQELRHLMAEEGANPFRQSTSSKGPAR